MSAATETQPKYFHHVDITKDEETALGVIVTITDKSPDRIVTDVKRYPSIRILEETMKRTRLWRSIEKYGGAVEAIAGLGSMGYAGLSSLEAVPTAPTLIIMALGLAGIASGVYFTDHGGNKAREADEIYEKARALPVMISSTPNLPDSNLITQAPL